MKKFPTFENGSDQQTKKSLCPAAYYHDLTAEQIALVCKLRRNIESFFAWWKHHSRVYHLIARTPYDVMVQMLGGLITYLLFTIYCHETYCERVRIERVGELDIKIINEVDMMDKDDELDHDEMGGLYAKV